MDQFGRERPSVFMGETGILFGRLRWWRRPPLRVQSAPGFGPAVLRHMAEKPPDSPVAEQASNAASSMGHTQPATRLLHEGVEPRRPPAARPMDEEDRTPSAIESPPSFPPTRPPPFARPALARHCRVAAGLGEAGQARVASSRGDNEEIEKRLLVTPHFHVSPKAQRGIPGGVQLPEGEQTRAGGEETGIGRVVQLVRAEQSLP